MLPNGDTDITHVSILKGAGEDMGRFSHFCIVINSEDKSGAFFFLNGILLIPVWDRWAEVKKTSCAHTGQQCPWHSLSWCYHTLEPVRHKHYKLNPAALWPYATNYKVEYVAQKERNCSTVSNCSHEENLWPINWLIVKKNSLSKAK